MENKEKEITIQNVKLSSPWVTLYHEIQALFKKDKDVKVRYNEEDNVISLYVDNSRKADALAKLLPEEKTFGNVTVKINVIPANNLKNDIVSLYKDAFDGNPALYCVQPVESIIFGEVNYVTFNNEVVQFYNDQMDDPNGNKSTLYQDIAKDIFRNESGVFFCTKTVDPELKKPLGEWP